MSKRKSPVRPTAYILFCLTGMLFVFCCLTERQLAALGNIVWTASLAVRLLAASVLGGCLLGAAVCFFLYRISDWAQGREEERRRQNGEASDRQRAGRQAAVFGASLGLTVLAWLPAYLAYYPAICAYDMPVQLEQITAHAYIEHHPVAHTLLLEGFLNLGQALWGSRTAGVGLLALLQLLLLAGSFALGVAMLYKRGGSRILPAVVQLWCMLYPFHWYMGVSITKDTIFTAFFVLQVLALFSLLEDGGLRVRNGIGFIVSTAGMILFRNNGKYAFALLLAVLAAAVLFTKKRKYFGKIFLWACAAFLIGNGLLSAVSAAVQAQPGDKREMLSVPIQQLARTMLYHGGVGALAEDDATMDEADKALVGDFLLNESYLLYRPDISDPVKRNTNTYVVRYRTGEFVKTYCRLLAAYPGDYINAVLALDAGYLYPGDVSHAYVNVEDERIGRGYIQTYWEETTMNANGIYKQSRLDGLHAALEGWADENGYLKLPVLKYLFVPGVWLWLYLLLFAFLVMKGNSRACIPLALVAGYFVTLLLGPTVQLRYLYPLQSAFPFVLLLACRPQRGTETPQTGEKEE